MSDMGKIAQCWRERHREMAEFRAKYRGRSARHTDYHKALMVEARDCERALWAGVTLDELRERLDDIKKPFAYLDSDNNKHDVDGPALVDWILRHFGHCTSLDTLKPVHYAAVFVVADMVQWECEYEVADLKNFVSVGPDPQHDHFWEVA